MNGRIKCAALVALAVFGGMSVTAKAVTVGDKLTDLSVKGFSDGELNEGALKGKVTVVNFWATWCASCKVELVEMEQKFIGLLEKKNFKLAFVSVDKDPQAAAEWVKKNLKTPDKFLSFLYKDPEYATAESLNLDSFPMTLVVDHEGVVRQIQRGYVEGKGSTEQLAKTADELLAKIKAN